MATSKKHPKIISEGELVGIFQDSQNLKTNEVRFCFLLGAGASKSSGIPTGWELAKKWYDVIKSRLPQNKLETWKKEIEFDENRLGEFYTRIYEKRFSAHPLLGYEEFKELMRGKEPSIGYVILAQILDKEPHNFVITTNFDHLIEDAVRMYADTRPFAVGHESLAGFLSLQSDRPSIIKIHRDLFLNPMNDTESTAALQKAWREALKPLLRDFNLLVLGYGGNDGSLMDYLCSFDAEDRKPIYWCQRKEETPSKKTLNLLKEEDFIVEIKDFDSLMYRLHDVLGYETFENLMDDDHRFVAIAKKRNSMLLERLNVLAKQSVNISEDDKATVKNILPEILDELISIGDIDDLGDRDEKYRDLLVKYPEDPYVLGEYAVHFHTYKNYDKAEEYYKKAINKAPSLTTNLGNYAIFLNKVRDNQDKAEEYYKKALDINPNSAKSLVNYAIFLKDTTKKYDEAEEYYKKAIEAAPSSANHYGSYAIFLDEILKEYDKAEEYYKKAIELDSDNPVHLGNYAIFLNEIKNNYDEAEEYYKKAIDVSVQNDTTRLVNYARFLRDIRENYDEAELYYKKAIDIEPMDQVILESYAIFLHTIKKDYSAAEKEYKKIIEMSPNAYNSMGNYAHLLILNRNQFKKASQLIDNVINQLDDSDKYLDLKSELWFYRFAHYNKYFKSAIPYLDKLVLQGAKSIGWDFQSHIEIAEKNGHPNIDKLKYFAKAFSE